MTSNVLRLVFVSFLLIPLGVGAQTVGDRVLLVERAIGIPGHPEPGNPGVSHRFPAGTTVTVSPKEPPEKGTFLISLYLRVDPSAVR